MDLRNPQVLLRLPPEIANAYPLRDIWMGWYRTAFSENPEKRCNCQWDQLYGKLQRFYGVSTNLNYFTDMSQKYALKRNPKPNGAETVTVVLPNAPAGIHAVCIGTVSFEQAKLIFASGQEYYAFDADERVRVEADIKAEANKPAKKEKVAKEETTEA
jgi:hypothetical protein